MAAALVVDSTSHAALGITELTCRLGAPATRRPAGHADVQPVPTSAHPRQRAASMNNVISRFTRLRSIVGREGDPYLRGRAMQLAGVALLADGLVGIENPLDGRNKRSGLLGGIIIVGIAVVFIVALGLASNATEPYDDGLTTQGTITELHQATQTGTSSSSGSCSATVAYAVSGQEYQVDTGQSSTSLCSMQGAVVDVSYRAGQPAAGRPQIAGTSSVIRYALIAVWGVLVIGLLTVLVRVVETVVGVVLLVRGRRLVRHHPSVPADEIVEELKQAWAGARP